MKILHTVEFYHPSKGGAQEVVRQLSERLVRLGHDVTVATTRIPGRGVSSLNGVKIREFEISGNQVRGFTGELEAYQGFLAQSKFDVVMNYAAQQWATDLCLPMLDQISAKKVLVPCGFSGLFDQAYSGYFKQMPAWLRQYDASVYLSNNYRDIDFARNHGISNIRVIPNGCGQDEFEAKPSVDIRKKLRIPLNHFLILHVGGHTGAKGHRELFEIFGRSALKSSTLLIVGNRIHPGCFRSCRIKAWRASIFPESLMGEKKVVVADLCREDTVAAYHSADLFLFPSNVECSPLVLFEAMASQTPFLTTDVGNSREIIDWSGGGMLLPTLDSPAGNSLADIAGSAAVLEKVWKDQGLRDHLAGSGYAAWKERFTWEKITREFERLYTILIDGSFRGAHC